MSQLISKFQTYFLVYCHLVSIFDLKKNLIWVFLLPFYIFIFFTNSPLVCTGGGLLSSGQFLNLQTSCLTKLGQSLGVFPLFPVVPGLTNKTLKRAQIHLDLSFFMSKNNMCTLKSGIDVAS